MNETAISTTGGRMSQGSAMLASVTPPRYWIPFAATQPSNASTATTGISAVARAYGLVSWAAVVVGGPAVGAGRPGRPTAGGPGSPDAGAGRRPGAAISATANDTAGGDGGRSVVAEPPPAAMTACIST